MKPYVITPHARRDLLTIRRYLEREASETVAATVLAKLEAAMGELGRFAGLGHSRSDVRRKHVLVWRVYQYLTFYQMDRTEPTIIRVIHGAQDIGRLIR